MSQGVRAAIVGSILVLALNVMSYAVVHDGRKSEVVRCTYPVPR